MIIAFTGKAGSGKSTAAARLVQAHRFVRRRFASPLKDMLLALGLTPDEVDGARKETPCELLGGKTPRHAMQTLGTEWGRELIDPDLWVRAWEKELQDASPAYDNVVVDDCRFPNEVKKIKELGGVIVRIYRPGSSRKDVHASEQHTLLEDAFVANTGTIEQFYFMIDSMLVGEKYARGI